MQPTSDLACETRTAGAPCSVRRLYGFGVEEAGGRARIASLHCGKIWEMEEAAQARAAAAVALLLREFLCNALGGEIDQSTGVLVAGLGNRLITADALGARTAAMVHVTAHAAEDTLLARLGCCRVAAISPGVSGQSGMEAASLIRCTTRELSADAVIVIDALRARDPARLGATVQLSAAGIQPGSGAGYHRTAVTAETVGVPVIALGVPTAIGCATLVWDALRDAGLDPAGEALAAVLRAREDFLVTPREGDRLTEEAARLLARAINAAVCPALGGGEFL